MSLDAAKVINVTPRYARLRAGANGSAKGQIIGWENIELISNRPLETMLKEFKQLKEEYPDRILIASIMEEYNKAEWEELIDRVEQTRIDALEIKAGQYFDYFSVPPEKKVKKIFFHLDREFLQWYQWEECVPSCSSWEDFVKVFCRDFGSYGFEDLGGFQHSFRFVCVTI